LDKEDIALTLVAANLDWAEVDPSILGTLFERGLDPDKRSQLGAHYTDREKIMMIVDPVIVRPWLAEWETTKAEIALALEKANATKNASVRTKAHDQAVAVYRNFLNKLRAFRVLDPACGSGNFLYLGLLALKDIEHRVSIEAEALGLIDRETKDFLAAVRKLGDTLAHDLGTKWYEDAYALAAFKAGVEQFLSRYLPSGDESVRPDSENTGAPDDPPDVVGRTYARLLEIGEP
jgi:type II restriction/modification system DNA methylase subunit YeeA